MLFLKKQVFIIDKRQAETIQSVIKENWAVDPEEFAVKKKQGLSQKWFSIIIDTYPADSKAFFTDNTDPFANPVGNTIKRNIDRLTQEVLLTAMNKDAVKDALEPIIRIRAVQEFSASGALAFILEFKKILRKEIPVLLNIENGRSYIDVVEANIDDTMLAAIDIYAACRHKIYTFRINESKKNVRQLLIKKNLMCELPEAESKTIHR